MKILNTNPKNVSWRLAKINQQANVNYIVTGDCGTEKDPSWKVLNLINEGKQIEYVDNFVFQAQFKLDDCYHGNSSISYSFCEKETKQNYWTSSAGMMEIVRELQKGNIKLVNGWFDGTFSFKKQGRQILFYFYSLDSNDRSNDFADIKNSVDVSDLL